MKAAEERALVFLGHLVAGRFKEAVAMYDARMALALPPAKLKMVWEQMQSQAGAFQKQLSVKPLQVQRSRVIDITCQFAKAPLVVRISINKQDRVEGLFFRPVKESPATSSSPSKGRVPAYVRRATFKEMPVTVGEGEWKLPGTLTMPNAQGSVEAVVLVHGSGPNDRDETIGPNKPFRDIAWGLASKGIAVLRYDKRTKVHGAKIAMAKYLIDFTLKQETIDDALAAVQLLRETEGVDPGRIFVLGHSLGGMALPRIGRRDPKISGLIFMAANSRPLPDLLVEQTRYIAGLDGKVTPEEKKEIAELRKAARLAKRGRLPKTTALTKLPLKVPAAYWLDLRAHPPLKEVRALKQRMLFLQGGRDYQVTEKDLEGWKRALKGRDNATFKLYREANHLLMNGKGRIEPAEYIKVGPGVSAEVIQDLAAWIMR